MGGGLCGRWGGGRGGYALEGKQQELLEKGREREPEPALRGRGVELSVLKAEVEVGLQGSGGRGLEKPLSFP